MKSKITIDLDYDNQPVIKIDYQQSEDVRDKMISRFLEKFSHVSNWCKVSFDLLPNGSNTLIRPISISELRENADEMFNRLPKSETYSTSTGNLSMKIS